MFNEGLKVNEVKNEAKKEMEKRMNQFIPEIDLPLFMLHKVNKDNK